MSKINIIKILKLMIISAFFSNSFVFGQAMQESNILSDSTNGILFNLEMDQPFGRIYVHQDELLDSLLRKHVRYNDSVGIQGYKILIYHGRERKMAQDYGARFNSAFPDLDLPFLVDYQAPDFKTLVGAFRTREEAYRFHQQIKTEFEFSYLVKTTIKPGELK
jgi:hypothetical protein